MRAVKLFLAPGTACSLPLSGRLASCSSVEFPDLPGDVVDKAIDAELKFLIPAQSVVTKEDQWKNLMDMQVYLGNAKGSIPFDQIIDNSFANKAVASLK